MLSHETTPDIILEILMPEESNYFVNGWILSIGLDL